MKSQLVLLSQVLREVRSAESFEELSSAVISARKCKNRLSRSNQLELLREINNKINSYF